MRRARPRISRKDAERLLGAGSAGAQACTVESDRLAALLASSSAPTQAGELGGEDAAVAAFRESYSPPVPRPARRRVPARIFSAKIAVLAMTVTAAGGIALASATDTLPLVTSAPKDRPSKDHGRSNSPTSSAQQPPGASGEPSTAPSPAHVSLCQVYQAAAKTDPGGARRNPAFDSLRAAAGGNVDGYCTRVLAAGPGAKPGHGNPKPGQGKPDKPGKPENPGHSGDHGKPKSPGGSGSHGKPPTHDKTKKPAPAKPGKPGGKGGSKGKGGGHGKPHGLLPAPASPPPLG